ncbi:MAG: hypothetical protein ACUVT7_00630 [Thermoplasmata archaeon]
MEEASGATRLRGDHPAFESAYASTFVSPANDSEINILRSKRRKVDDLLETLHRTLKDQMVPTIEAPVRTVGPVARPTVVTSILSGAKASRVGRKHEPVPETPKKTPSRGKRGQQAPLDRSISRLEELVLAAQALGIDMFYVSELVKEARLTHSRGGDPKRISSCITKAERRAEEVIHIRVPELMKETEESLKRLERLQGEPGDARDLLEKAKNAMARGRHSDALRALGEARIRVRGAEHDVVLSVVAKSKDKFVQARKSGLKIDFAVHLLSKSRDSLKKGALEEAIKYARESGKAVDEMLERRDMARNALVSCVKSVRLAETLGTDIGEMNKILAEARSLFKENEFDRSIECSRKLYDLASKAAFNRAAEACDLAERSLALAKNAGVEVYGAEKMLQNARETLGKEELLKSVSLSCTSIFEANSAIMTSLNDKLRSIDQFTKGIEGEVESLTEVQEAIAHSKEKSLEDFRRYVQMSEEIVSQAFDSAIAYTRVSQDVVRQAYDSSISMNPTKELVAGKEVHKPAHTEVAPIPGDSYEDKRLRIVNLYLEGKINDGQLERLLSLIDSSVARANLV